MILATEVKNYCSYKLIIYVSDLMLTLIRVYKVSAKHVSGGTLTLLKARCLDRGLLYARF